MDILSLDLFIAPFISFINGLISVLKIPVVATIILRFIILSIQIALIYIKTVPKPSYSQLRQADISSWDYFFHSHPDGIALKDNNKMDEKISKLLVKKMEGIG